MLQRFTRMSRTSPKTFRVLEIRRAGDALATKISKGFQARAGPGGDNAYFANAPDTDIGCSGTLKFDLHLPGYASLGGSGSQHDRTARSAGRSECRRLFA